MHTHSDTLTVTHTHTHTHTHYAQRVYHGQNLYRFSKVFAHILKDILSTVGAVLPV